MILNTVLAVTIVGMNAIWTSNAGVTGAEPKAERPVDCRVMTTTE